jgi:hypothetical protein
MPTPLADQQTRHDGIEARLFDLAEECTDIRAQLEHAEAKGDYDRRWFVNATTALRYKTQVKQRLQNELGRVNREIKAAKGRAQDARFADIAKRRLPPDIFQSILAELTGRSTVSA